MGEVALIVAAVLGVQAFVWAVILSWARIKRRRLTAALRTEVCATGETVARGPESAVFRGATGALPTRGLGGGGVIVLTDRRLLFRSLFGGRVELALDQVVGLREATWFRTAARAGRRHLILRLHGGAEAGFYVADQPGWIATLREAMGG